MRNLLFLLIGMAALASADARAASEAIIPGTFAKLIPLSREQLTRPFLKAETPTKPKFKKLKNVKRYRAETKTRPPEPCREDARTCAQNRLIAQHAKACDANKSDYSQCLQQAASLKPSAVSKPSADETQTAAPIEEKPAAPKTPEKFKSGVGPVTEF